MKGYYGDGIRHYRELKDKMKQETLSNALKMSRQNLSEMEQNRRKVSDQVLQQMAKALDTTPEKIIEHGKGGLVINSEDHPIEQHNHCTVQIPVSLLEALQTALKTNQEDLQIANAYIVEMTLRLAKYEQ